MMKRVHCVGLMLVWLMLFGATSCSDDEKENGSGITRQSWNEGETLFLNENGTPLSIRFTASGNWTVRGGASWCEVSPSSGGAGEHDLIIIATSATTNQRSSNLLINVNGSKTSSSVKIVQKAGGASATGDVAVNRIVDDYLKKMYLWNEEYRTLSPNFELPYNEFLTNTLMSMSTNTLDKKLHEGAASPYYTLFSFIQKKSNIQPPTGSTRQVQKEFEYSFGIFSITIADISKDRMGLFIQGIYPESSAFKQGLRRGMFITKVNGADITESNFESVCYTLVAPSKAMTVSVENENEKTFTLNSAAIALNPILHKSIERVENAKIGYLVYHSFDAGFDGEVFDVFKEFKSNNITDLIIDLRYNGGGHVMSANLIASCIAGSYCQDKVFNKSRYNKERIDKQETQYEDEYFEYANYSNLGHSLSEGGLNLRRVYCIVSGNSYSASELLINSLRGIDIEVILIGMTTGGKNVGMEPTEFKINNSTYLLAPITFQCYNAKGFGSYENGFVPDVVLNEKYPEGDGKFYGYVDFGIANEILYAKALSLITGKEPATTFARASSAGTSYSLRPMKAVKSQLDGKLLK